MAISPGAPVALRRSLDSGGHSSFAPTLQIAVAVLAVVSMPLFIGALNEYYGAAAVSEPLQLARQVFVAQLLPLSAWHGRATPQLRVPQHGSSHGCGGWAAYC